FGFEKPVRRRGRSVGRRIRNPKSEIRNPKSEIGGGDVRLDSVLFSSALGLYFFAAVFHHAHLFSGGERSRRVAQWLVAASVLVHGAAITVRIVHGGRLPFSSSFETVSFSAWLIALVQLLLQL